MPQYCAFSDWVRTFDTVVIYGLPSLHALIVQRPRTVIRQNLFFGTPLALVPVCGSSVSYCTKI